MSWLSKGIKNLVSGTKSALKIGSDAVFGTDFTGQDANAEANKANIQAQKEINDANIANQWALLQNEREYNSPSAVMQRYVYAGLNPNLAYGSAGTGSASSHYAVQSAPVIGSRGGSKGNFNHAMSVIDSFNAIRTSDAVVDTAVANAQNVKKTGKKIDAEIKRINAETDALEFNNSFGMRALNVVSDLVGSMVGVSRAFRSFKGSKGMYQRYTTNNFFR